MTASEILRWIERNATQVLIQSVPRCRRAKNRIIVQYRTSEGTDAVGAPTISAAVSRAALRMSFAKTTTSRTEVEMPIPSAETRAIASQTTRKGATTR